MFYTNIHGTTGRSRVLTINMLKLINKVINTYSNVRNKINFKKM